MEYVGAPSLNYGATLGSECVDDFYYKENITSLSQGTEFDTRIRYLSQEYIWAGNQLGKIHKQDQQGYASVLERSNVALCLVDVQGYYCDKTLKGTDATESIIQPISSLKARFNEQKIPVFVIYMDGSRAGIHKANRGLYGIDIHENDVTVPKDADSAFQASKWCGGPHIRDSLNEHGINAVLVAGVHFSVCVANTAIHASKEFNTFVVGDCTANGQTLGAVSPKETAKSLSANGVGFVSRQQVLEIF